MVRPMNDRSEENRHLSLLAIDQYHCEMAWIKINALTQEEENQLLHCIQSGKVEQSKPCPDQSVLVLAVSARDRLIEAYQPLLLSLSHRYLHLGRRFGMELTDLAQEANLGLLLRFDDFFERASSTCSFRCFVSAVVVHALATALGQRGALIRLPDRVRRRLARWRRAIRELSMALGYEPSGAQVAHALGLSEEEWGELVQLQETQCVMSMQQLLVAVDGEEDRCPFQSLFSASAVQEDQPSRWDDLHVAFEKVLTARQGEVLQLRYRFDDQGSEVRSHALVADLLGVTESAIGHAEQAALSTLRKVLTLVKEQGAFSCRLGEQYQYHHYYTLEEAAHVLGLSRTTLQRQVKQGRVPYVLKDWGKRKVYLFSKQEIDSRASSSVGCPCEEVAS